MKKPHHTQIANATAQHLQKVRAEAEQAAIDQAGTVDLRQLILHASGQEKMTFMEPGSAFDECIVGAADIGSETVVVYNKMAVILAWSEMHQCTVDEAWDAFQMSLLAARTKTLVDADGEPLPQHPLFLVDIRDFVA